MISRPKKWGVFLTWPEPGRDWVHPEDLWLAEQLIPSQRVFSRVDQDADFNLVAYGRHQIRMRPVLWLETSEPDYELGETVAIRSDGGRLDAQIASIREVLWNSRRREIEFELFRAGRRIPGRFRARDLQGVAALGGHLRLRHLTRRQS